MIELKFRGTPWNTRRPPATWSQWHSEKKNEVLNFNCSSRIPYISLGVDRNNIDNWLHKLVSSSFTISVAVKLKNNSFKVSRYFKLCKYSSTFVIFQSYYLNKYRCISVEIILYGWKICFAYMKRYSNTEFSSPLKRTLRPSICLSVDSMFAKLMDSRWTISFRLNETLTSSAQIQSTIIFQNFCHVKVFIFRKHLSFHCFDHGLWRPINHHL